MRIWFTLWILLGLTFVISCNGNKDVISEGEVSRSVTMAPDFALSNLEGKTIRLSDFKGKVIILDFWATWCPPCRAEIPHFNKLHQIYSDKGLAVVGISVDEGGKNVVKPFVEEFKIPYPILLGNEKVARDFGGIRGIPTTFIINKNGEIIKKLVGYHDQEEFESIIKPLL